MRVRWCANMFDVFAGVEMKPTAVAEVNEAEQD